MKDFRVSFKATSITLAQANICEARINNQIISTTRSLQKYFLIVHWISLKLNTDIRVILSLVGVIIVC